MSNEAIIQLIGLGQGGMLIVGVALVGWLIKISSDVSAVKERIYRYESAKDDSSKVHDELFGRMRKVERVQDRCQVCSQQVQQIEVPKPTG